MGSGFFYRFAKRKARLEINLRLGVLALLAVFVDRLGLGFGSVVAFGAGLVGFGSLVFLGALWLFRTFSVGFEHVLSAFYQVVGSFLHCAKSSSVGYGVSRVGGYLLHFVGSGRSSVGYLIEQTFGFYAGLRLFFLSSSVAVADVAKRDFSSSRSTFFSTGVRSKFLILRVSLLARAMFLRCLRFRRVTDMISGEMRVLANEVQK